MATNLAGLPPAPSKESSLLAFGFPFPAWLFTALPTAAFTALTAALPPPALAWPFAPSSVPIASLVCRLLFLAPEAPSDDRMPRIAKSALATAPLTLPPPPPPEDDEAGAAPSSGSLSSILFLRPVALRQPASRRAVMTSTHFALMERRCNENPFFFLANPRIGQRMISSPPTSSLDDAKGC